MICKFRINVDGPRDELHAFQTTALKDTKPCKVKHPDEPGFILDLKPEFWGKLRDGQEWLSLTSATYFPRESVLGVSGDLQDYLVITGEARHCPIDFVEIAANKFPRLDFAVRGTSDDEYYEHWQAQWAWLGDKSPRTMSCIEKRVTCRQSGDILELEIQGQRILPREDVEVAAGA